MPPKAELSTFIAGRDSAIVSLNDLLEEFHVQVEPVWSTLEYVDKEVESKYRKSVIGDEAKANFLKCEEQFVIYQKSFATEKPRFKHEALEAMTLAVTKMTNVLSSQKYASHGLEKLSVLAQLGSTNCQFW
ncbi:unnamed protein product [Pocillopora meandrina]|uniref:Uncharacterized protein n=1 Tax=Pocillopora meandrina TaxID=46732 RepID=A0AAU9XQ61_9CNID|nr:unnamed protein product [Pocillopora meandrina]